MLSYLYVLLLEEVLPSYIPGMPSIKEENKNIDEVKH
jgi:hypothetical protein